MIREAPPALTRVLLHVEFADGSVREIDADRPVRAEVELVQPYPDLPVCADVSPHVIAPALEPVSVALSFRADSRYPLTVRTVSTVDRLANARKLDEIRALADARTSAGWPARESYFGEFGRKLLEILNRP